MSDVEKAAKDYGFKLWNETGFDQETAGWCSMGFKAGAAWQRAGYDAMMADRHRVIEENARYKAALEEIANRMPGCPCMDTPNLAKEALQTSDVPIVDGPSFTVNDELSKDEATVKEPKQ
jgi:hypothetical protein